VFKLKTPFRISEESLKGIELTAGEVELAAGLSLNENLFVPICNCIAAFDEDWKYSTMI